MSKHYQEDKFYICRDMKIIKGPYDDFKSAVDDLSKFNNADTKAHSVWHGNKLVYSPASQKTEAELKETKAKIAAFVPTPKP